jgi:hypothetical protein
VYSRSAAGRGKQLTPDHRSATSQSDAPPKFPWIVNPVVDLLLCCGGLLWILAAFDFFVLRPSNNDLLYQAMALCTIAGTHVLSETHIGATLARVYKTPERSKKFALYTRWAASGCLLLGIAGLFVQGLTPVLAKIYLLWVAQHFTAQTYGLVLMYCYKSDYVLSAFHKRTLSWLMNSTAAFAMLRQLTYKEWNPDGFLAQHIPFWGPLPEWMIQSCTAVLIGSAVAFVCCSALKFAKERKMVPLPAMLNLLTGVLIFVVGRDATGLLWLYVPAFYHGSQYVVLSIAYYLRESGKAKIADRRRFGQLLLRSPALRYQGLLLLIAIGIFIGLPRLLGEVGISYTLAFATIFVSFNLHHFITDRAIWKLRDREVRDNLLA